MGCDRDDDVESDGRTASLARLDFAGQADARAFVVAWRNVLRQGLLLHDAAFAFEYQTAYEKNELLMPGETITTTCTCSEPKSFGQGTNDEMCYLFTYASPKGALTDNGLWGTFAHGEGVCLGQ